MSGIGQSEEGVASTSGMMETSMMEGEEYYNPGDTSTWTQKEMSEQLCRICSKPNQYLIPIFEGEGIEHQLESKIQKHLPIEVLETDELPLQVCYQCASTLIAWNDLVIACIEADKKLRQLFQHHEDQDDKGAEFFDEPILDSDEGEEPTHQSTSPATVISDSQTEILSTKRSPGKAKKSKLQTALLKSSTAGPSGHKPLSKKTVVSSQDDAVQEGTERSNGSHQHMSCQVLSPSNDGNNMLKQYSVWIQKENRQDYYLCDVKEGENHIIISNLDEDIAEKRDNVGSKLLPISHPKVFEEELKQNNVLSDDITITHFQMYQNKKIINFGSKQGDRNKLSIVTPSLANVHCNILKFIQELKFKNISTSCIYKCHRNAKGLYSLKRGSSGFLLSCPFCSKHFKSVSVFQIHCRFHTNVSPFYCKFCDKRFKLCSSLQLHLKCCLKKDVAFIINHSVSSNSNEQNECTLCGKKYKNKASLKEHLRNHIGQARKKLKCNICGIKFLRKAELLSHASCHKEQDLYQCELCKKQCVNKRDLEEHQISHSNNRPFSCSDCGASYKRKSHLTRHRVTHSNGSCTQRKRYVRGSSSSHRCLHCGKEWATAHLLDMHIITHTGQRNHFCNLCGKGFGQFGALQRHSRTVHGGIKRFECNTCGMRFTAKVTRDNHMLIHSGQKPFGCEICNKAFRTTQQLNLHKVIHSEVRPYSCSHCSRTFRRRPHLTIHLRTHTGEKPYSCPVCGRAFSQKNDMSKHIRLRHPTPQNPFPITNSLIIKK